MNNLAELVRRLPEPYEDELWYSVLSRYHRMSGNLTERETYREIMPDMIKGAESSIPILTINNYSIWLMKGDERKLRDIYFEHTLEPYWFRFSKTNSKRSAYVQSITKPQNKKADTILTTFHLDKMRYCPLCAEEEREQYGETFWHRLPQIPLLTICPKHKCRLVNSNIRNTKTTRLFIPSNIENCPPVEPIYLHTKLDERMANSMYIALNAPHSLETDISTQWLRNEILSYENSTTKYLWRIRVKKICREMEVRYGNMCDAFEFANAIYSIMNGKKYNVPTETYILLADFFGKDINEIM